jgi:hypothetical protein
MSKAKAEVPAVADDSDNDNTDNNDGSSSIVVNVEYCGS